MVEKRYLAPLSRVPGTEHRDRRDLVARKEHSRPALRRVRGVGGGWLGRVGGERMGLPSSSRKEEPVFLARSYIDRLRESRRLEPPARIG